MTPNWVKDATFYQIFPDRFRLGRGPIANPAPVARDFESWEASPTLRGFKGGNLWGVIEELDYIKNLGFNALYLCPILSSTANHRYHTSDYFLVDPILGGNEALKALVEEAHKRDIRVVLDGVFNHCGRAHFAFQHVLENGAESPYKDWFHIRSFPLNAYAHQANYAAWWNNPELPKFNTSNPECREYLLSVAEYWLDYGIDGWRLDVPNEIDDDDFWREFRRRVKAKNPDAYIVGEIWNDAHRWLQGDQFDAVMNYPLGRAILGLVGGDVLDKELAAKSGLGRLDSLGAMAASHRLEDLFARYNWEIVTAQMNILTSHDTPRIYNILHNEERRVALAFAMLFTLPGVPTVYYGDEIGLAGGHDPDNRRGMIWEQGRWHQNILQTIQRMTTLRQSNEILRKGRYTRLYAQDSHLAYARTLGDESLIVTVNASTEPWQVNFPHHGVWSRGEEAIELITGKEGRCIRGNLEDGILEPFTLGIWQIKS